MTNYKPGDTVIGAIAAGGIRPGMEYTVIEVRDTVRGIRIAASDGRTYHVAPEWIRQNGHKTSLFTNGENLK